MLDVRIRKTRSCWLWTGATDSWGYGKLTVKGRTLSAHRWVWEQLVGEIPRGKFLCHTCDRPECVNPKHLYVGDQRTNMDDMIRRGKSTKGERHPMVKLTARQVKEIRRRTESNAVLGREYGVSGTQISRIRSGQRWA